MKRYLPLVLTVVPVLIAYGNVGCKKTVPTLEAGADPSATAAAAPDDAAAAAPVAEADAAPAATLSAAATVVRTATKPTASSAAPVAGGAYQGTYTCFGGMTVSQAGFNVSARQKPGDTANYAVVACNASGDSCDGTTTMYAAGKAAGTKKSSLKRNPTNGDLTYRAEGETPVLCHKR